MYRGSRLIWIGLMVIVLLPSTAGRLIIDLASGLFILSLLIPLSVAGIGWVGWKFLKSKMVQCEACGATTFGNGIQCSICGSDLNIPKKANDTDFKASSLTIDINAEESD